jgi:hypothetical protein
VSRDDETCRPIFGGLRDLLSERRGNLVIFIPFCNINLLISFHSIFRMRRAWAGGGGGACRAGGRLRGWGLEESSDGGWDSEVEDEEEQEGTRRVWGWTMRGWG